jgi:aminopeptidase N
MWIGNHVTPVWWDEVWLKEGLGTFIGALTLSEVADQFKNSNIPVTNY